MIQKMPDAKLFLTYLNLKQEGLHLRLRYTELKVLMAHHQSEAMNVEDTDEAMIHLHLALVAAERAAEVMTQMERNIEEADKELKSVSQLISIKNRFFGFSLKTPNRIIGS